MTAGPGSSEAAGTHLSIAPRPGAHGNPEGQSEISAGASVHCSQGKRGKGPTGPMIRHWSESTLLAQPGRTPNGATRHAARGRSRLCPVSAPCRTPRRRRDPSTRPRCRRPEVRTQLCCPRTLRLASWRRWWASHVRASRRAVRTMAVRRPADGECVLGEGVPNALLFRLRRRRRRNSQRRRRGNRRPAGGDRIEGRPATPSAAGSLPHAGPKDRREVQGLPGALIPRATRHRRSAVPSRRH